MDTRPVLGLSEMRPAFLDHLSAARPAQTQAGHGTDDMIRLSPDDDADDDFDDDDDFDEDDDDREGDDDEADDEDVETWQVSNSLRRSPQRGLTSVQERA